MYSKKSTDHWQCNVDSNTLKQFCTTVPTLMIVQCFATHIHHIAHCLLLCCSPQGLLEFLIEKRGRGIFRKYDWTRINSEKMQTGSKQLQPDITEQQIICGKP